jgi:L-ribulose-5-phosphate 4-epimerase
LFLGELREQVAEANRSLAAAGLVSLAFGNASGIDRERGLMLIKASGVACERCTPHDVVAVALDGGAAQGPLRPSSDTPTHLVLYRRYPSVGGVVHTHSPFAAAWAQAGRDIPCLGTTHADHFSGPVPVTRALSKGEIGGDYEAATGDVIVETLAGRSLDPLDMPATLVMSHGPFTWGTDPADATVSAVALEVVAAMAWRTLALSPDVGPAPDELRAKHFSRKHGPDAYYGQPADAPPTHRDGET